MNDNPQPDNLQHEKSLSDRILGFSLAASLVINLGWVFWVAHSDIFGSAANIAQLHEKPIKIFKPIPQKPKPKPPKPLPPPPPPKQRPQPKIKPPPLHIPRPTPQPPVPTHHYTVATTHNVRAVSNIVVPSAPDTPPPPAPSMPSYTAPPVQAPPPPVEQPPAPEVVAPPPPKPEPPAPKPEPPPPPPPPKVEEHRPGYNDSVVSQEAAALSDYSAPEVSDDDNVAGKSTVVTWSINERGRATNVHTSHSCGNHAVDQKCEDIIRGMRFQPAYADHYFQEAHLSHEFGF